MKINFKILKILGIIAASAIALYVCVLFLYLKTLPSLVSSEHVHNYLIKQVKKSLNVDLLIDKPVLNTYFSPKIDFNIDKLSLKKEDETLFELDNFKSDISFQELLKKRIKVNKLGADNIFADVNALMELAPKNQSQTKESDFYVDFFESLLYVKKCLIVYDMAPDTNIKVKATNIRITETRNPKFVNFDIKIDIKKGKDTLKFAANDNKSVFIDNHTLYLKDCYFDVNKSRIYINASANENRKYDIKIHSKKFDVDNIVELTRANFLIPNGEEILSYFKNIRGDFDFNIDISNSGIEGTADLNRLSLILVPLADLKINANGGRVKITPKEILLSDFKGYYGKNTNNKLSMSGIIKDYMKSFDTEIAVTTIATKEFSNNHLTKIVGYPLEIVGKAGTKIVYKSIYDKMDIIIMSKLAKGDDILVDGASLSPVNYDRAVKADLHLEKNILNIKDVNYYIAQEINKNSKIKPILTLYGNVDISGNGCLKNLGFNIPRPLPSEFLNVLIGQKVFKKGTIAGFLEIDNNAKYPVLKADMQIQKVRVPSQRLFIKEGKLSTNSQNINLAAQGRYKRSSYDLSGNILNEIKFPIVVKNITLGVDNLDIEKILNSFNSQNSQITENVTPDAMLVNAKADDNEEDMDAVTFNTGVLIVENCVLKLAKGVYKDINFGNLKADLTLDKDGILKVKSNRFDIAEGISSCKVNCDLKNHKYSLIIGVKDINSDLMASTLLELKREISGKASGIISLNTDDSLRLNGFMKFIVKDGTIGKIGLVEYVLKFAALFRNPMAMISPSTLVDLVNIPEGNFEKITGDLQIKDNVIEKIMIKSQAPQLSSFIVGRFDLDTRDATLRIYTKFSNKNKGFTGALRNISLNSLANRVPLSSRNDSNYYALELEMLPPIDADEKDCQVFLTKVDGDVEHNNFISSLKKIK